MVVFPVQHSCGGKQINKYRLYHTSYSIHRVGGRIRAREGGVGDIGTAALDRGPAVLGRRVGKRCPFDREQHVNVGENIASGTTRVLARPNLVVLENAVRDAECFTAHDTNGAAPVCHDVGLECGARDDDCTRGVGVDLKRYSQSRTERNKSFLYRSPARDTSCGY